MIIIRDQVNYWRGDVTADTLELKDCNNAEIALTVESTCGDYSLFSFTPDCDIPAGSHEYDLLDGETIVKTGFVTVR